MQLSRCPICHSRINLDALIQDESGRSLLVLLSSLDSVVSTALVSYLGLFRPATRDLANDRALRLAKEVIELEENKFALTVALNETVQAMRVKQDQGVFKPLSNHRYLGSVLETVLLRPMENKAISTAITPALKPVSKTAQAIELLKTYPTPDGIPEWFTRTVCCSLAELFTMGLEGVPAFDTLSLVIERFLNGLWSKRQWQQDCRFRGARRLHDAFVTEAESKGRWPQIKAVLGQIPTV